MMKICGDIIWSGPGKDAYYSKYFKTNQKQIELENYIDISKSESRALRRTSK